MNSRTVNGQGLMAEFMAEPACQNPADAKAFTGRGKHRELRHLLGCLAALEAHMNGLVEATRQVPGHTLVLALHRCSRTGLCALRWRMRQGQMRHLPWAEAAARVAVMPHEQAAWYSEVTERSVQANETHKRLRRDIQSVRRVIASRVPHLFARPERNNRP